MKVLQICQKPPLPAIDGGTLASYQLSLNLLDCEVDLKILSMATDKHAFQPEKIDKNFLDRTKFEAEYINTHASYYNIILNFLSNSSIQKNRFYHDSFSKKVLEILNETEYDFIILDGLMPCFYIEDIRKNSDAQLIYRSHNIEGNIFKQLAENEKSYIKAKYYSEQGKRLEMVEKIVWNQVDQIWSISSFDSVEIKRFVENDLTVNTLPFSMAAKSNQGNLEKNTFFHLGAMDWQANIEGISWFIKEVWPEVIKQIPSVHIHLGGKSIEKIQNKLIGENVVIHQSVENADEFYDKYDIMVVPVRAGSGIRIKLIQALSKGKVIVGTKRSVMGIPVIHNEHMMICENSADMQDALIALINDEELKEKLSRNAKKLFDNYFDRNKVSSQLKSLLKKPI